MNKRTIIIQVLIIVFLFTIGIIVGKAPATKLENPREYFCDVKNLKLSTTINIKYDNKQYANVSGNIFRIITDPLTMYKDGDKVAYADDSYHFIAQDSHSIFVDPYAPMEMIGKVKFIGEHYDIYFFEDMFATVKFNFLDTKGEMYDIEGHLIAEYASNFYFNDFYVRISDECILSDDAVLMIFCSYYSDKHFDKARNNTN